MYRTSIVCGCGNEFDAETADDEMDSAFNCDCGASYLLTVTRLVSGRVSCSDLDQNTP